MRLFTFAATASSFVDACSPTDPRVTPERSTDRLIAAARDAAALDAHTAALADRDGGQGATDHLARLLATAPTIDQAKGVLMGYYGIDADAAFAVLRRWSSHHNVKLSCLAEQLVTAAARSGDRPFAGIEQFLTTIESGAGTPTGRAEPPLSTPRRPAPSTGAIARVAAPDGY